MKQVRETLLQQENTLKRKVDSLENDVKQVREANKKQFHSTIDTNPETAKKDKIILESLSIYNQELIVLFILKGECIYLCLSFKNGLIEGETQIGK